MNQNILTSKFNGIISSIILKENVINENGNYGFKEKDGKLTHKDHPNVYLTKDKPEKKYGNEGSSVIHSDESPQYHMYHAGTETHSTSNQPVHVGSFASISNAKKFLDRTDNQNKKFPVTHVVHTDVKTKKHTPLSLHSAIHSEKDEGPFGVHSAGDIIRDYEHDHKPKNVIKLNKNNKVIKNGNIHGSIDYHLHPKHINHFLNTLGKEESDYKIN